jgi:hypothetical protein
MVFARKELLTSQMFGDCVICVIGAKSRIASNGARRLTIGAVIVSIAHKSTV